MTFLTLLAFLDPLPFGLFYFLLLKSLGRVFFLFFLVFGTTIGYLHEFWHDELREVRQVKKIDKKLMPLLDMA